MKTLIIGGTGNISAACVRLALSKGHEITLLNRGRRALPDFGIEGAESLVADIHDESATAAILGDRQFDAVANFIAFTPAEIERDLRLFENRTAQYIFISSASVYQKPLANPFITESTPLVNPYWEYSRKKIACEERLVRAHRDTGFPHTIIRPSLTYEHVIPLSIGGWNDYGVIERIRAGKPLLVHGDGTSLWTITHSRDFAKGFVGLLGNQRAIGENFHITSDEVLSWNQIYDAVGIASGCGPVKKVHLPSSWIVRAVPHMRGNLFGDKAVSALFDNSKIKSVVPEFLATTRFQDGIRETLAWFEADPRRMRTNPEAYAPFEALIEQFENL